MVFTCLGLQVADATVFAHLKQFDVSSDLSMQLSPTFNPYTKTPGLGLTLNLKTLPASRPLPVKLSLLYYEIETVTAMHRNNIGNLLFLQAISCHIVLYLQFNEISYQSYQNHKKSEPMRIALIGYGKWEKPLSLLQ